MENKDKNKHNNNISSNSLVFGRWPQAKIFLMPAEVPRSLRVHVLLPFVISWAILENSWWSHLKKFCSYWINERYRVTEFYSIGPRAPPSQKEWFFLTNDPLFEKVQLRLEKKFWTQWLRNGRRCWYRNAPKIWTIQKVWKIAGHRELSAHHLWSIL